MAFLDEVLGEDEVEEETGFLAEVGRSTPRQAEIARLKQEGAAAEAEAKRARSVKTLAKETGKGVLDFTKRLAGDVIGAAVTPIQAGVSALRNDPKPVKLPPLKSPVGDIDVETAQNKATRFTEQGDSIEKASLKAGADFLINEPLGVAPKALFVGGAIGLKALKKLAGEKTTQGVVDVLYDTYPNLHPRQLDTIVPHIVEADTAEEVARIVANPPPAPKRIVSTVPGEAQVAEEVVPKGKVSKVAQSVDAKAVEKGISESGLSDLAEYTPTTIKEQSERAAALISEDYEQALKILDGSEKLPSDLRAGTLIKAMEDIATKNADGDLLQRVAKSPLTGETSVHAQELRMLAERNPDSPVAVIKDVNAARREAGAKRYKNVGEEQARIAKEIKGEITKTITPKTWDEFVDSITC